MGFVFVSYFRENKAEVAKLLKCLEEQGVAYWIDEEGMEGGELWRDKIARKIDQASAFLFCMSKVYYQRQGSYVHQELELALKKASQLDRSVTWVVPLLLDDSRFPAIELAPGRQLADHHVIRFDSRGMSECARRLSALASDPSLNLASIRLSSASLFFGCFVEVNASLLRNSGEWIETEVYKTEYQKAHPFGILQYSMLDVFVLERNSTREFLVPPGACRVCVKHMTFSQGIGQWGPVGEPSWVTFPSNVLELRLRSKERKNLLVRDTPRSGFLWLKKLVGTPYFLSEV